MNRLFILSAIGIIASIALNILALSGIYLPNGIGFMFILFFGVVIVFLPAVLKLQKLSKKTQKERPKGIKSLLDHQKKTKELMLSFWRPLPLGLKILLALIVTYGFANFFAMLFLLGEGQAEFENGKYFIENHGRFVRDITQTEYYNNKGFQTSLFTGHIAIFYCVSMMFHYKPKISLNKKTEKK